MYDYIIIGSGIVGSLIARELSKYDVSIMVFDKENDFASHQTTANSAIIHSGHDPKEGTLKARLCVEGNRLYDQLEKELEIPLLRTGAFVVAHGPKEEKMLEELYDRAHNNGVPDVHFLDPEDIFKQEPRLIKTITKVLSLPSTKVTYPWEVAFASLENAVKNGASIRRNSHVVAITKDRDHFLVELKDGTSWQTKRIINASGVMSDIVASLLDKDVQFQIIPRRGEYMVLDRRVKDTFHHVIYPLPTSRGKGVLIVPQVHGNILLGPTSEVIDDREDASTTKEGILYIKEQLHYLSDQIPFEWTIRGFAGVRATSTYDDFYIQESKYYPGFYHVAGIDSPGLTSAPAIARYLVEEVIKINQPKKINYDPIRQKKLFFNQLSEDEKSIRVKDCPSHGRIVCKCEKITEQDIIESIHGPLGNDTVKGIKKRARAGSGLCQGGYCESMVLQIIAKETNKPLSTINYDGEHTPILVKETKTHEHD
jgi:glycerol-3-phosphate dehydrogenase